MVKKIKISKLNSDNLEVKKSFEVEIEKDRPNSVYIIWCEKLLEYGTGETIKSAINDFCTSLEEFYFELKDNKNNLGKSIQKIWDYMKTIIKEK